MGITIGFCIWDLLALILLLVVVVGFSIRRKKLIQQETELELHISEKGVNYSGKTK